LSLKGIAASCNRHTKISDGLGKRICDSREEENHTKNHAIK
jgi:hypothetical protein